MRPEIYKIQQIGAGFLAVMAKPVSGEWIAEEFRGIATLGVRRLVSLMEIEEMREVGLAREPDLCRENSMGYIHFPIRDRGLPASLEKTVLLVKDLHAQIKSGKNTAIHCRAGIGRSGLIAACVLVREGYAPEDAFRSVSKARKAEVPDTLEQREWLLRHRALFSS
ncbi:MAG TPA: protein-tyrosine phosphatase family protein [Burkholderiaceae bacterium]